MLVGYVSNERYVALADMLFEFRRDGRVATAHSTISGTVYADIEPGEYEVVLGGPGHWFKDRAHGGSARPAISVSLIVGRATGLYVAQMRTRRRTGRIPGARGGRVRTGAVALRRRQRNSSAASALLTSTGPRANMQITPDGDYTQTGVQWNKHGYHSKALGQFVEAPQRSGLYYMHARDKEGRFFTFPWVVAPTQPTAPVAVLASDINWNAYNSFGGRSNYIHADCFPATPTINARLELKRYTEKEHRTYNAATYAPLSLERPDPYNHIDEDEGLTDPIAGRQGCHMAAAEWRLFGWMEHQGIDYDLYGETQFHFDQVPLDQYKVLVISTHPEYWSKEMYFRLKHWVFERGGRLLYLGGNGLNCEVEFLDDPPHRVPQHQLEPFRNPDPPRMGESTRGRFDRRVESEANLLGVVFSYSGIMTAAPYRVLDDTHWCFAGTGLKNGDVFGEKSLHQRVPGGASGHETDKMSPQSPTNTRLLAKGLNPDEGGAEIVEHTTASGGAVFSVGSICWPASILVDEAVSKITENTIRRYLAD